MNYNFLLTEMCDSRNHTLIDYIDRDDLNKVEKSIGSFISHILYNNNMLYLKGIQGVTIRSFNFPLTDIYLDYYDKDYILCKNPEYLNIKDKIRFIEEVLTQPKDWINKEALVEVIDLFCEQSKTFLNKCPKYIVEMYERLKNK